MKISKIYPTSHFTRAYRKLPENIKKLAQRQEKIFLSNPFERKLNTHKLKGELSGYWSYRVNYEYRLLFRFCDPGEVLYYDIGTHEIYR
ncbi:MAG: type II toxin-antitoxin system mRNA interferase toxin, RelE/StbE family [Elusimicrobia bacterium HGW-Elusimicrobia-1]|jgi:addiction module RelE/StbE family toxin|nr:MAG: type II toxin-antitoxin system mRNA interferase toxin, RelE/StbE family [Elusimicrobia bacterium HGW-Elusimicrobia-1]